MENMFELNDNEDSDVDTKESSPESLSLVNISYSDIARKLINDKLLLSALELHAELLEGGKEIPRLREFFSNPSNFENLLKSDVSPCIPRSSSQATLDSLDFTRFSEDGERGVDERIAVLEFELRKAKETINALRANLTVVTVGESGAVEETGGSERSGGSESIKPHEERALNFLINEYLLYNGYKLTSITFSDENETQDFEDWEDVGLNRGRPASLLELYRGRWSLAPTADASTQVDDADLIIFKPPEETDVETEERIGAELDSAEIESPSRVIEGEQLEKSGFEGGGDALEERWSIDSQAGSEGAERDSRDGDGDEAEESNPDPSALSEDLGRRSEEAGKSYEGVLAELDRLEEGLIASSSWVLVERMGSEEENGGAGFGSLSEAVLSDPQASTLLSAPRLSKLGMDSEPPELFSSGLPRAVWSQVIGRGAPALPPPHHPLLTLLALNIPHLSKVLPLNENQWLEFLVRLIAMATALEPEESGRESLLGCLVSLRKRPSATERATLINGLGSLSECGGPPLVEGMILPQVCQLVSHKTPEKRLLAVEAFHLLAAVLPEELRDSLLLSMIEQLISDKEESVREGAVRSLSLLASLRPNRKYDLVEGLLLGRLSDTSPSVAEAAHGLLLPVVAGWSLGVDHFDTSLVSRIVSSLDAASNVVGLVGALQCLIPHFILFLATDPIVVQNCSTSHQAAIPRKSLMDLFKGLKREEFLYNLESPTLSELMISFDSLLLREITWPRLNWLFDSVLSNLVELGEKESESEEELAALISFFNSVCSALGPHLSSTKVKSLLYSKLDKGTRLVAVYILAVAPHLPDEESEVKSVIGKALLSPPLSPALLYTISTLASSIVNSQLLASSFWQGVVDDRCEVKLGAVEAIVASLKASAPPTTLLPLVITLASDTDPYVRGSSLSAFSLIMEYSNENEVLEKSRVQIQSILSDQLVKEKMPVQIISSLAKMVQHVDQSFREEVIAAELSSFIMNGFKGPEIVSALVDAYTNAVYLQMGRQTIANVLLPSLRALEWLCLESLPTHTKTVTIMIKEMEGRVETPKHQGQRSGEEMRQRVTRMFGNPPAMPSLFKKK